jgi:uncharacterized ferritin-like protein (DUF455 family)
VSFPAPDWNQFHIVSDLNSNKHGDAPRAIHTKDGIGDRLRAAAFAEIQARDAFNWAADRFEDAAPELREAWRRLAKAEEKHLTWLLNRMKDLGIDVRERKVSDLLWRSLIGCTSAREFALFMANSEERGRKAGERFSQAMAQIDPISAEIFGKIAEEEVEHIALAQRHFGSVTVERSMDL